MRRLFWGLALLVTGAFSACAQFDGSGSTGVSASLIRLFGTNNTFTAQAEVQVLGKDNKEIIGTPMTFTLAGNKIRAEVDLTRMRNKLQPDAIAQMKPLGLDSVTSIIRPETRTNLIIFPKLRAYVKLDMPPNEAEAFLRKAKIERTTLKKEKMEGYNCVKQRVVITDDDGHKSEATVWTAPELRGFPVCVATREKEGTVTVRFRKVQFTAAAAGQFEPPAGFIEYADMQQISLGPGVKYMRENGMTVKADPKTKPAATKAKPPATKPAAAPTKKKP